MALFKKKSSASEKTQPSELPTDKIQQKKQQLIDHNNTLNQAKEKADGKERARKKAKTARQHNRKHKDASRTRFGVHDIHFSSETAQITEELNNNKSEIENFLNTHDLSNLSLLTDHSPESIAQVFSQRQMPTEQQERLITEYKKLLADRKILEKRAKKAHEYDMLQSEWKQWESADSMPSASVKDRIVDLLKKDAIPKGLAKIPIIGPLLGMGFVTYSRLHLSVSEVRDETRNILSGTRKRTAMGRIAGMLTGSVVGAAGVGASLALVGSIFPGVGTAIGGVAGIILGSTIGAAAGGPIGVKIFNVLATTSKGLRDELDYEMSYTQLKNLRTVYGLGEDQVLKMNAYLSNQINREGPKSNTGKALAELKKSALVQGKQNALAKLCFYFIGQEKILRTELYNTGMEFVDNQQERVRLLEERQSLERQRPSADQISNYENELKKYPFIKALYLFKKENNIMTSYTELVTDFFESYSATDKQAYIQHLQSTLGIDAIKADEFIQLMLTEKMNSQAGLNNFINKHALLAQGQDNAPSVEAWMNQLNQNNLRLEENKKAFQDISNRNVQLDRDRDGVMGILKEFKEPSELNQSDQTWIYGEMKKIPKMDGTIENLFSPVSIDNKTLSTPKDFRSFGSKHYAVLDVESDELKRANFREDMREFAFEKAVLEADRYPKDNNQHSHPINAINIAANDFIENLKSKNIDQKQVNEDCKKIIFDLKKLEQTNPDLKAFTSPKINALEDIQFYLDYVAINSIYSRKDLGVPQNSFLRDLYPYTETGAVMHVKENNELKKSDVETIIKKMNSDNHAHKTQERIESELKAINQMNSNIEQYNQSNLDKISNEPQTLNHSDLRALRSADAHARATGKKTFTAQYKKYTTSDVSTSSEPTANTQSAQNNTLPQQPRSIKKKILGLFSSASAQKPTTKKDISAEPENSPTVSKKRKNN